MRTFVNYRVLIKYERDSYFRNYSHYNNVLDLANGGYEDISFRLHTFVNSFQSALNFYSLKITYMHSIAYILALFGLLSRNQKRHNAVMRLWPVDNSYLTNIN